METIETAREASLADAVRDALELVGRDVDAANRLIEVLYAPDVVFRDPLQTIRGRDKLLELNRRLVRRSKRLDFRVHAARQAGELAFLTWTFEVKPKPFGPTLRGDGVSALTVDGGRVIYHRDYFDPLGTLMDALPGASLLYRAIVASLS